MGGAHTLPGQARHEPVKLFGRERQRARVIVRPSKTATLQAPRTQPHSRSAADQYLQPVSAPVGKYIGMVGLCAQSKTPYDLGKQCINANSQITYPQGQPDVIDADHRASSRTNAESSRVCDRGPGTSTHSTPPPISTRTQGGAL